MAELWSSAKLRLAKYSRAYKQRLLESFSVLCEYLKPLRISPSQLFSLSKSQTDTVLERFIDKLHSKRNKQKGALSIGKHAVLFVQIVKPRLRFQLKAVWASLKAWEEQEPSQLRAPIPLPVLLGVLCQARMTAEMHDNPKESVKLLRFSALVSLGYFGLLRPGELLKLKKEAVDLPNQLTFGAPCVTVRIRKPKNYRQLGHSQFSVVRQCDTCNWISWLVFSTPNDQDLLWPHSQSEFRKIFKQQCSGVLGKHHPFTPASLRAGGATYMFDMHADVNRLRLLGRWANVQSLEHYVQTAKSQQLTLKINEAGITKITKFLTTGHFLLQVPYKLSKTLPSHCLLPSFDWTNCDGGSLWSRCRRWGCFEKEV